MTGIRGLFTGPQHAPSTPQQLAGDNGTAAPGTGTTSTPQSSQTDTQPAEQPGAHPDYPAEVWPQGSAAPPVFARLQGWTPGTFPPPAEGDPLQVAGERYTAHRELWHALQRWDREQARLDERAAAIRRAGQQAQAQAEQDTAAAEAAEAAEQARAERHAARLQQVHEQAEGIGLRVLIDRHEGRERVRLTAPDTGHPAVGQLYPWETPGMLVQAGGGIVVDRAGDTLASAEQFLTHWQDELAQADRERRDADQQHRQRMLQALRERMDY